MASKPLDDDGFCRAPQNVRREQDRRRVDARFWYYEEKAGLIVCNGTEQVLIPWRQIKEYAHIRESL